MIVIALSLLAAGVAFPPALAAENPTLVGRWSKPFWEGGSSPYGPPSRENAKRFPTAVSAAVLPDGRLLYWNGAEGMEDVETNLLLEIGSVLQNSRARVLDLRSRRPRWTVPVLERGTSEEPRDRPNAATHDLFCADQKFLYDGTLLLAGGSEWRSGSVSPYGLVATRIFDPRTDRFRAVGDMHEPRWYPSLATLADGRVLAASGLEGPDRADDYGFGLSRLTEIYDPSMERWSKAGVSAWTFPTYPRLHLLPDGTVFYGGAGEAWAPGGFAGDEAMWSLQRTYDPATKTWSLLGPALYGARTGATSTLLRLEPPYREASILLVGGALGPSPGAWFATTLSEVVRWTPDGMANETVPKGMFDGLVGDGTQLRNPRWHGSSVLLPTGEVLLLNGGDADDVVEPGSAAAVRMAELYDPKTGTWRELSAGRQERVYHSSAVLLPDGRVLVGGHAPIAAHYGHSDNTLTRSNNFRDSTFEIYEPPYLFRGRPPVVSSVVPSAGGRALRVTLGKGTHVGEISELVLVRIPATTHTVDADMRAVKLQHRIEGSRLIARLPRGGDGRLLPPGPYYLFAMRDAPGGAVPSVARVVLVRPAADGRVVARVVKP